MSSYDHLSRSELIARLRASEAAQRAAGWDGQESQIDRLAVGVVIHGSDGQIIYANDAACRIFGLRRSEFLGQTSLSAGWQIALPDGSLLEPEQRPIATILRSGAPILNQIYGWRSPQRPDWIWVHFSGSPQAGDGGAIERIIVTMTDITAQRHAEERQRVLASATSQLAASLDIEATLRRVTEMAVPTLADWCSVLLYESPTRMRRVASSAADEAAQRALAHLQQEVDLSGVSLHVTSPLRTGATDLASDADGDYLERVAVDREHMQVLAEIGTRSIIRTPLRARGRTIGIFVAAYGRSGRRYSADDIGLFEELARTAALAIDNARLYHEAQRHLTELSTIQRTSRLIASTAPLETIVREIVSMISSAFGYQQISIYLLEGSALRLQAALGYDQVVSEISVSEGISGRVVRTNQPIFVSDARADTDFILAMPSIAQCIIVPLHDRAGDVIGTLAVESTHQRLTEDDLRILTRVADQINIAIADARLFSALRDSERRYRAVIDQAADAILLTDADWRIIDTNREAERLTGRPAAELVGAPIMGLLAPGQRGAWPPEPGHTLHAEQPDGSARPIEASIGTLQHSGQAHHIVILHDITERVRIEELHRTAERQLIEAQNMESLGVMASGIAHDFNNVLMAIAGNAGLVAGQLPPDSPHHESLAEINDAAERAASLTQQLLAYTGKMRSAPRPLQVDLLFDELSLLIRAIVAPQTQVRWDIAAQLPSIVADSGQMRQLLLNLVTNAAEAIGSQPGEIVIAARARQVGPQQARDLPEIGPGSYLELSVSDSGPGIDPLLHRRIFEPFYTTKFTGRGLGLAVVYGVVRSHHGALRVVSAPGQGASFTVLLPAAPPAPAPRPHVAAPAPSASAGGRTILVVDDERAVRQTLTHMLQQIGYPVLVAEEGRAALRLIQLRRAELALVLLDLTMPELSGAEVLGSLRQLAPELPVVMITGYSVDDIDLRFGGNAPHAVLHKPFGLRALREALAQALEPGRVRV